MIEAKLRPFWENITRTAAGRALLVFVVLAVLALAAIHPSTFGALPKTDDGLLHLYRLVGLDHAMQHDGLWPRYVPGMAYGYGVPVFNYYSPVSLFPMQALHFAGVGFLDALLTTMILYTLLGMAGVYLLGKVWGSPLTGIIAAVAYGYAPYTLINWPRRGAIAEVLGLALLSWTLWAFWRLARRGRRIDFVLATALFALIIISHNITALLAAVMLIPYCLILWWTGPEPRRTFIRLIAAGVIALGLAAFFWMPALFETDYVHIARVTYQTGQLDYTNHFLTLSDIFALPPTADLTQLNSPVPRALGWIQVLLGITGGTLIVLARREDREGWKPLWHWFVLATAGLIALLFLMGKTSTFIWATIPLMHFIQFPWRMLGPASILLAVLAGLGVQLILERIAHPAGKAGVVAGSILLLVITGLPWLYGQYLPAPPADSIIDAQNYERTTGHIGGTAEGEYVPIWVEEMPDPDRLTGLYAQNEVIPRLQPASGVSGVEMNWEAVGAVLTITAEQDTQLVFDWLYFPGWWAQIDGEDVEIEPTQPTGLISFEVEAGTHTIELGFGPTPLRRWAGINSILFAVILLGGLVSPLDLWRKAEQAIPNVLLTQGMLVAAALAAGLLAFSIKALWLDNVNTPLKRARFANSIEAGLDQPVMATLGDVIRLIGYDLPNAEVRSGKTVTLALYWELTEELVEEDYSSVVILQDSVGNVVQQIFEFYPAGVPTSTWVPGFYVREEIELEIPPGTPPGTYTLSAGIYSNSAERNVDVIDADGNPIGVLAPLGAIEVQNPRRPASMREMGYKDPLNANLSELLVLIGINALPRQAEVGQSFPVIWTWQAQQVPLVDYAARLIWLDNDQIAGTSALVEPATGYATSLWERRDVWRGLNVLYVPGRLSAGTYDVAIELLDATGERSGEQVLIGEMQVSVPPRSFGLPEMDFDTGVAWVNDITLAGYDLPNNKIVAGHGLDLSLYWQAETDVTENLTVFIHLVSVEGESVGQITAQQDQIPTHGTRPTTGWAPGEVVEDKYALFIRPDALAGAHVLRIGLYNAQTGTRVTLPDGSEFWEMPGRIEISQ